jgi:hypothetical protein
VYQAHDHLAAIGEADRVHPRPVTVEAPHQEIDCSLGKGDVVDAVATPMWSKVFAVNERIAFAVCIEP